MRSQEMQRNEWAQRLRRIRVEPVRMQHLNYQGQGISDGHFQWMGLRNLLDLQESIQEN